MWGVSGQAVSAKVPTTRRTMSHLVGDRERFACAAATLFYHAYIFPSPYLPACPYSWSPGLLCSGSFSIHIHVRAVLLSCG